MVWGRLISGTTHLSDRFKARMPMNGHRWLFLNGRWFWFCHWLDFCSARSSKTISKINLSKNNRAIKREVNDSKWLEDLRDAMASTSSLLMCEVGSKLCCLKIFPFGLCFLLSDFRWFISPKSRSGWVFCSRDRNDLWRIANSNLKSIHSSHFSQ